MAEDATYQGKNYREQGGTNWVIVSGGTLEIASGGTLDINGAYTTTVTSKTAAYTCTTADSGKIFLAGAADLVFTLPSTAAGLTFTFVLAAAGLSTGTGLSISPAAADKIMGNGFTSADDKDAVLAGSGDREGDAITIVGDGADGWYITSVTGTWSRQA
jgi:hypothetical protein